MTTQQVGGDGWDDEVMIARWRNAFGASPDVHEWAYLCWLRDDLRQTIATQAAKIAQVQADNERLRAELASTTQWVPAPDGQIPESNLWIVSAHGDGWFLEFGKNGAKVWFPGVVRIYVDSEQIKTEGGA